MSIQNATRQIKNLEMKINAFMTQYQHEDITHDELKKLKKCLQDLQSYLNNLDRLKPDYNTNELNHFMNACMVHVDILQEKLTTKDFRVIKNSMSLIKTMLRFHPTKFSMLAFITAWILEMIYFI